MDAAEAHKHVNLFATQPSTKLQNLLLYGDLDRTPSGSSSAASGSTIGTGLLSVAVRLYSENRVPLGVALQLLGRLNSLTAHTIFATAADGTTALMDACRIVPHQRDLVHLLLIAGAGSAVNASGSDGLTALMLASRFNFTSATQMLIDHSADVDQLDAYGRSALHHAVEAAAARPATVLIAADATIHRTAHRLRTTSACLPAYLPACVPV